MKYIKDGVIYDKVDKVFLNDRLILNPTDEQILAAGYQHYIEPAPNPIEVAREQKLKALEDYDASEAVTSFLINGNPVWIYPADRTNYLNTLQGAQRLGIQDVPFMGYTVPVNAALNALDQINVYAMQAVAVTDAHRSTIEALSSIEEIEAYDFTKGYPQKIEINL